MQENLTNNTNEFAREYLVKPQTVLKRFSQTGSYFGVVPLKLPNGRLAWPVGQKVSEPCVEEA